MDISTTTRRLDQGGYIYSNIFKGWDECRVHLESATRRAGDFPTIQAAIDRIEAEADLGKRYRILIAAGEYVENLIVARVGLNLTLKADSPLSANALPSDASVIVAPLAGTALQIAEGGERIEGVYLEGVSLEPTAGAALRVNALGTNVEEIAFSMRGGRIASGNDTDSIVDRIALAQFDDVAVVDCRLLLARVSDLRVVGCEVGLPTSSLGQLAFEGDGSTGDFDFRDCTIWAGTGGVELRLSGDLGDSGARAIMSGVHLVRSDAQAGANIQLATANGTNCDVEATACHLDTIMAVPANQALRLEGCTFRTADESGAGILTGLPSAVPIALGQTSNLSVTVVAGLVSVTGAGGVALTANNPGMISVPSALVPGEFVTLRLEADAVFRDSTHAVASDIIGQEFGVDTGVVWGEQRPFFVYAVNEDDTDANLRLALSPNPAALAAPAAAGIAFHLTPAGTPADENFFFLTAVDPSVSHAGAPCQRIGAISMTMDAADDWAAQAPTSESRDGILPTPFEGVIWDMQIGQMGAVATGFFKDNGGTAPTFTNNDMTYRIGLDGVCETWMRAEGDGGTAGAGAVDMQIAQPYSGAAEVSTARVIGSGFATHMGGGDGGLVPQMASGDNGASLILTSNGTAKANSVVGAGARDFQTYTRFVAFGEDV